MPETLDSEKLESEYNKFNNTLEENKLDLKVDNVKEESDKTASGESEVKELQEANEVEEENEEDYEPEEEEEIIDAEDICDREDPSELEVEKFNLPSQNLVLEELTEHSKKKKLIVHPLKINDLANPVILDCISNCSEFKTTFVESKTAFSDGGIIWAGVLELFFKSAFSAAEAVESIKLIREDINVKHLDISENSSKKIIDSFVNENTAINPKTIGPMLLIKHLDDSTTLFQLKQEFTDSIDIIITKTKQGKRLAYAFYENEEKLAEALGKYKENRPVINNTTLRVYMYQQPEFPSGLLRMKRRFKILMQIQELKKILKEKKATISDSNKKKIRGTIKHCKSLIEKDDTVREKLNLPLHSFKELRRIKVIRESVPTNTIWIPGPKVHNDDEDNYVEPKRFERRGGSDRHDSNRRYGVGSSGGGSNSKSRWDTRGSGQRGGTSQGNKWKDNYQGGGGGRDSGSHGNVPSLMDMSTGSSNFNPIARVQEIAAKIAQMACNINPNMRASGVNNLVGNNARINRMGGEQRSYGAGLSGRNNSSNTPRGNDRKNVGGGSGWGSGSGGGGIWGRGDLTPASFNKRSRSPPKIKDEITMPIIGDGTDPPKDKIIKSDVEKISWGQNSGPVPPMPGTGAINTFTKPVSTASNRVTGYGISKSNMSSGAFQQKSNYNQQSASNQKTGYNAVGNINNQSANQSGGYNNSSQSNNNSGYNQWGNYGTGAQGGYGSGTGVQSGYGSSTGGQSGYGSTGGAGSTGQADLNTGGGSTAYPSTAYPNQSAYSSSNQMDYSQQSYQQGQTNATGYNQNQGSTGNSSGYNYDYSSQQFSGQQGVSGGGYNYGGYGQWPAAATPSAVGASSISQTDWSQQQSAAASSWPTATPDSTGQANAGTGYNYNWNSTWQSK